MTRLRPLLECTRHLSLGREEITASENPSISQQHRQHGYQSIELEQEDPTTTRFLEAPPDRKHHTTVLLPQLALVPPPSTPLCAIQMALQDPPLLGQAPLLLDSGLAQRHEEILLAGLFLVRRALALLGFAFLSPSFLGAVLAAVGLACGGGGEFRFTVCSSREG
jgi:hypothetical protein